MSHKRKNSVVEWLNQLESRHPQEIQLGLARIRRVGDILNLLNPRPIVITVAGTNGKGSTVALLESIYYHAGFRVASFTSPHLVSFNERIKVNQQAISDRDLLLAFDVIDNARDSIALTYFEVVTLAALWHFAQCPLDIIILEVGLGGRLDATNIIDCDLAIITTIDFDHQDYLGNNLDAIGYEKAGIIRAKKPIIYADYNPPDSILNYALALDAPIYRNGHDYYYRFDRDQGLHFYYQTYVLPLPQTIFHHHALAAAVMAICCLQERLPVNQAQCLQGLQKATLAGRLQLIKVSTPNGIKQTLLDVAHNPQAAHSLAHHLRTFYKGIKLHVVFAALTDKDLVGITAPLKELANHWYLAQLSGKRAATLSQLTDACYTNSITALTCYGSPQLAYQAACNQALVNELIIVYGSFLTVGSILSTVVAFKDTL